MISHLFRPFASLFLKVNFANRFWTNKVSAEQVAKRLEQEGQGGTVDWGYPVMAVDGLFHGKSWIKKADDDIGYPHLRKLPNFLFWSVLRICETHHLQKYYWKSVGLNTIIYGLRITIGASWIFRWSSTTQRQYSLPRYCGFARFDSLFFLPKDGCIYIISNWYLCTSRVKQTGTVDRHYVITLHYVRLCRHHRPHRPFHSYIVFHYISFQYALQAPSY